MKAKRWLLAAGVSLAGVAAVAGLVGGAGAATTATDDDAPLAG